MNSLKLTLVLLLNLFFIHSSSAVHTLENSSRSDVFDTTLSVDQLLNLNAKSYRALTGEKMKLKDRIALGLVKVEVKHKLSKGEDMREGIAMGEAMENFSIGGFLLGLFLGLIGVLIALLWSDRRVRRSAWKGLLVWLLVLILFGINLRN